MIAAHLLVFILCAFSLSPNDTIESYAATMGIPVEKHWTTTDDGFNLQLFRFPRPGAPVVYFQHGILASAWCWLVNYPENSPGFVLYDQGYDVWFGNSRGNIFSRNHTDPVPERQEYWNFTFTTMARYDLPKQVDYILETTQKPDLSYFAWSQGTTQLFIASANDWIDASKFNIAVAVSPVSYIEHCGSKLIKLLEETHVGDAIYKWVGNFGFFKGSDILSSVEQFLCKISFGLVCEISVDLVCGSSKYDGADALSNLTAHFPAGTSSKDMIHYSQLVAREEFGDFDYGDAAQNRAVYGTDKPPQFDIGNIDVPLALFMGTHDTFVPLQDVARFMEELSPGVIQFNKTYDQFSHVTWLVGVPSVWGWFTDALVVLHRFNPVGAAREIV